MIEIDYGNGNTLNVSGLEAGYEHGRNDAIDALINVIDLYAISDGKTEWDKGFENACRLIKKAANALRG